MKSHFHFYPKFHKCKLFPFFSLGRIKNWTPINNDAKHGFKLDDNGEFEMEKGIYQIYAMVGNISLYNSYSHNKTLKWILLI